MKMYMNKKKKGFTLIELIVVIAILGILAAVLIPKFSGFQDKAHGTQAMVDSKNIATAIDSLYVEKSVYPSETPTAVTTAMVQSLSGVTITAGTNVLIYDGTGGFTYAVKDGSKWYIAGRDSTGQVKMHSTSGAASAPAADLSF